MTPNSKIMTQKIKSQNKLFNKTNESKSISKIGETHEYKSISNNINSKNKDTFNKTLIMESSTEIRPSKYNVKPISKSKSLITHNEPDISKSLGETSNQTFKNNIPLEANTIKHSVRGFSI